MYHYNNVVTDVEDLIYDFLCYRRNKKQNEVKMKAIPFCTQSSLIEDVDFEIDDIKTLPKSISCQNEYNYAMAQLSQELNDIINEILEEYEYEGSPIFEEQIDKEALAQIVSKVIELAIERIDGLKDISNDTQTQNANFSGYSILQALVEALVINNIYLTRKDVQKDFNNFMPY